ncbi:MAG: hypothetical protein RBR05_01495 [Candidatus Methanomethylophilaceae archaeon]|nr:hypothetical protein [Candidatus Methanomethylophilaceae archaeon]
MLFNKSKDVPPEIVDVDLGKWYTGLNDQEKVKLGRYLKESDTSSRYAFLKSIVLKANEDENYKFAIVVGEYSRQIKMHDIEQFNILEELIPAYFGAKDYDKCLECCNECLALIPKIKKELFAKSDGPIPERLNCRNYKVNVLVGVRFDYDAGDQALDEYYEMGILSEEDLKFRKQSNKIFKLQKTFDGIYTVKLKDE